MLIFFENFVVNTEKYLAAQAKLKSGKGGFVSNDTSAVKGDSTKARTILGWKPEYTFEGMMDEMVEYWHNYFSKNC